MPKNRWIVFIAVVVAFLGTFWYVSVRHEAPVGQPALADVTRNPWFNYNKNSTNHPALNASCSCSRRPVLSVCKAVLK